MLIIITILKPGKGFRMNNYFELTENFIMLNGSLQILLDYQGGKHHPNESLLP